MHAGDEVMKGYGGRRVPDVPTVLERRDTTRNGLAGIEVLLISEKGCSTTWWAPHERVAGWRR